MENSKTIKVENCMPSGKIYFDLENLGLGRKEAVLSGKINEKIPFIYLSLDEIRYTVSISKVFEKGLARIANSQELPEDLQELLSYTAVTVNDIDPILTLTSAKRKKKLAEIESQEILKSILTKAHESNMGSKDIAEIQARIDELDVPISTKIED